MPDLDARCAMCAALREDGSLMPLFETADWRVYLAPEQSYLGKALAILKRHASDGELTTTEVAQIGQIRSRLFFRARAQLSAKDVVMPPSREGSMGGHALRILYPRYGGQTIMVGGIEYPEPLIDPSLNGPGPQRAATAEELAAIAAKLEFVSHKAP